MKRLCLVTAGLMLLGSGPMLAGPNDFQSGTVIPNYGKIGAIPDARLGPDTRLKVAFDIGKAGTTGLESRYLTTPARFLNMHAAAGVPVENMKVAIVVHGEAYRDLLKDEAYGGTNANAGLIAELLRVGATIELCGQTVIMRDVNPDDLLPGVTISLSAMTSHALLQQQGYTLNPF